MANISSNSNKGLEPAFEFRATTSGAVLCLTQLWDGTLLLSTDELISRWTIDGIHLQTFADDLATGVFSLIQLDATSFASCSYRGKIVRWSLEASTTSASASAASRTVVFTGKRALTACIKLSNNSSSNNNSDSSYTRRNYSGRSAFNRSTLFVVGDFAGDLLVYDFDRRKLIEKLSAHKTYVTALTELRSGYIVTGTMRSIKVWDIWTYRCVHKLKGHEGIVLRVLELDEEQAILASCSTDRKIKLWNLKSSRFGGGKCIRTIDENNVPRITKLKDGRLASASLNIRLYELTDLLNLVCDDNVADHQRSNQGCRWTEELQNDDFSSALLQLKDGTIAAGLYNGKVRIWRLKSSLVDLCCILIARKFVDTNIDLRELTHVIPDELYTLCTIHFNRFRSQPTLADR